MKYLLIACLFFCLSSCSRNCSKCDGSTKFNIEEFYFPLNAELSSTTYTYAVKTETSKDTRESFEYLKFQKLENGNYACSRYGNDWNLLDSALVQVNQNGANVEQYFVVSEDSSLIKTDAKRQLIYAWKMDLEETLKNEFSYTSKMYGSLAECTAEMDATFKGFENVRNSLSKNSKCAKLFVQTKMKFKNLETEELVHYSSKDTQFYANGIGLVKSIETNNYGVKITKQLVEIKKGK